MKKIIGALAQVTLLVGFTLQGLSAFAAEEVTTNYLFNCNLSFSAKGKSVYLGLGYTETDGTGTLSCFDFVTGVTEHIPLKVSVRGVGVGLGVTGYTISGGAINLGINKEPESLLGTYLKTSANAALGFGAEAGSTLRFTLGKGSINIGVEVSGRSGLGAGVDISRVRIERAGRSRLEDTNKAEVINSHESDKRYIQGKSRKNTIYLEPGESLIIVNDEGKELYRILATSSSRRGLN